MSLTEPLRILAEQPDFLVVEKPKHFRTHRVSDDQLGFIEALSEKLGIELWVVHRLDKETSGLMIFAKNKLAAQNFFTLFESKDVQKTYVFLTDHVIQESEFTVETYIEKAGSNFVNLVEGETNSKTHFRFLQKIGHRYLWQAQPETGKPHQIRLHAEHKGIPILGDRDHGGSPWFRLALHAQELKFKLQETDYQFLSSTPLCFTNPGFGLYLELLDGYDSLNRLYTLDQKNAYRLIQISSSQVQADLYGSVLWVYWYQNNDPTEQELSAIKLFCENYQLEYILRIMTNRGQGVSHQSQNQLLTSESAPDSWIAEENNVKFLLQKNAGYSPGLFLDQRQNRQWVKLNSKNLKVLNLFSYTSGFSVCAAISSAREVTTVDASSTFLNWSKENFKLNNLNSDQYEFFIQDVMLFLKGSLKRGRKWDLIVCDPPSFGRTKNTIWKIEKDLPELALLLSQCLNAKGQILFTCNYEKWNLSELKKNFQKKLTQKGHFKRLPAFGFDYDLPDSESNQTKGFIWNF